MFDLENDDFKPGRHDVDWLETVKRANLKTDARDFHPYRIVSPTVFASAIHHVEWFSEKKGGKTGFPRLCPRLNPETFKLDRTYPAGHPKAGQLVDCAHCDDLGIAPRFRYYMHAIDRVVQMNSPGLNPVVVLDLPETALNSIIEKKKLNIHGGQTYSVAHPQYGQDIFIKLDPNAPPAKQYSVERGNPSALTAAEMAYPLQDLKALYMTKGFVQADPAAFREFLIRVKLIGAANTGTQMPSGGKQEDQLQASWGGPSFAGGDSFGGTAQTFQPQTGPAQTFQPPAQFGTPASAQPQGFQPPQTQGSFQPPTTGFQAPATRFSGPPTTTGVPEGMQMPAGVQMPTSAPATVGPQQLNAAAVGKPECFQTDDRGLPKCSVCPVKNACWEIETA